MEPCSSHPPRLPLSSAKGELIDGPKKTETNEKYWFV